MLSIMDMISVIFKKKIMRIRIITICCLVFSSAIMINCQDITIGYLITEYASYSVDSMIVKKNLDTTPPSEIPNPRYEMYIEMGFTPQEIADWFDILPTMMSGEGEDYERVLRDIPWVSSAIEGIEGTPPILVSIKSITTDEGDIEKLSTYLSVRGNGMLQIPVKNDIPAGRYKISLTFTNEGRSQDVNDCFTIIVK